MTRAQVERLLPHVIRRAIEPKTPIDAMLGSMDQLLAPVVDVLDRVETYFHPYRTPDRFVAYLSSWVDLDRIVAPSLETGGVPIDTPEPARARELIAAAASLSKWRGTARGLIRFIETATGVQGVEIEDPLIDSRGREVPFAFRVRVPGSARGHEPLIRRIVDFEKPAYVTFELTFDGTGPEPDRAEREEA
jgi:phage tail-like protein